jgi:hypothetical protein
MVSVKAIPVMGIREDRGEWWRRWLQVLYIWYIVTAFEMPQCTPPNTTIKKLTMVKKKNQDKESKKKIQKMKI